MSGATAHLFSSRNEVVARSHDQVLISSRISIIVSNLMLRSIILVVGILSSYNVSDTREREGEGGWRESLTHGLCMQERERRGLTRGPAMSVREGRK